MTDMGVAPDWAKHLHRPMCDLHYEGCQTIATQGYRVHGCAFHFACESCSRMMMETILKSYTKFSDMYCKDCGMKYELPAFVNLVDLRLQ